MPNFRCRSFVLRLLLFAALLNAFIPAGVVHAQTFQIGSLAADDCQVVSHNRYTGDDRGPLAVGAEHVLITGDSGLGRFDLEDLGNPREFFLVIYDTLTSNLRTGEIFTFAYGSSPVPFGEGTATALLEIDGRSGQPSGRSILLSRPLPLHGRTGFFAGWDRVVVQTDGKVYDIDLRSGRVRGAGTLELPDARLCEIGDFWGVAEFFDGALHLAYRGAGDTIVRTRVDDGTTTVLAEHERLGDLCAFSVAPAKKRWYFQHEGLSQFALGNEVLGFCTATAGPAPRSELSLEVGELPTDAAAGTAFDLELTVRNDGPARTTGARFETQVPATVQVLAAVPSQGRCRTGCFGLSCDLGALPPGRAATIDLELLPLAGGPVTATARVTSQRADNTVVDNAREWTIDVPRDDRVLVAMSTSSDELLVLDPQSGAVRARIPLTDAPIVGGYGLATHPETGELWALVGIPALNGRELAVIDPLTGAVRRVGDTGQRLESLAFDAAGRLWSQSPGGIPGVGTQSPEGLVTVDLTNASVELVAPLPGVALAYDPNSDRLAQLVDRNTLRLVNPATAGGLTPTNRPGRTLRDPASCRPAFLDGFSLRPGDAMVHLGADVFLATDDLFNLYQVTAGGQRKAVGVLGHGVKALAWIEAPAADLALTLEAAAEPSRVGTPLTYTMTVENRGPGTAGTTVISTLPATASVIEARPARGTCRPGEDSDLDCHLGELLPGESTRVEVEVVPRAAGTMVYEATARGLHDPEPGNDTDHRTTSVLATEERVLLSLSRFGRDLRIVDPTTGTTLSRLPIVKPEGVGGSDRVGALVVDPVSGKLQSLMPIEGSSTPGLVAIDPRTGRVEVDGRVGAELESLAFGADGTLYGLSGVAGSPSGSLYTVDPSNGTTTFVTGLLEDDEIVFSGVALAFHPGAEKLWAFIGMGGFTTFFVTVDPDTLETERGFLSFGTGGRPFAATHLGGDLTLLYEANSGGLQTAAENGHVRQIGRLDHASRGLAFVSGLPRPHLVLDQSSSGPTAVGRRLDYTLTLTNAGAEAVDGVILHDELPGVVSLIAVTPSSGSCRDDCGGVICELGRLESGDRVTVELSTRALAPGTATNTARLEPTFGDSEALDNVSVSTTRIRPAGPSSRTLLSLGTLASGTAEAVHLHVVDPSAATTRSTLEVRLPGATIAAGLGLAAHPATGELFALLDLGDDGKTELARLDPLTGRAERVATLDTALDDLAFDGSGTLYARGGASLYVIDPVSSAASVLAAVEEDGALAWNPEDGLLYHAASGLLTVDPADGGVTVRGTCTALVGDALVHVGENVLLLASSRPFAAYLDRLTADGGRARIGELDHASSGLAWVDLARGNLAVTQRVAPATVRVGRSVELTATVTNRGMTTAPLVELRDTLPGSFRVDEVSASRGSCEIEACGGAVRCDLGSLDGGARATVRIRATALVAGSFENDVRVPALDDPDLTDNQVTARIDVRPRPDEPVLLALDVMPARLRVLDPGSGKTLLARHLAAPGSRLGDVVALAAHPTSGELWALLSLASGRQLAVIHPDTAVVRAVGTPTDVLVDLVFDNDGTLYGIAATPPGLFEVDPTDASTTFVTGLADGGATAFHPGEERLYHLLTAGDERRLRAFDPASGMSTDAVVCGEAEADALEHLDGGDFLAADGNRLLRVSTSGVTALVTHLDAAPAGLVFVESGPARAQLKLSQSAAPDPAVVDAPLVYTLRVENTGPDDVVGGLTLIESLAPTVSLDEIRASQGECHSDLCGTVACELGALAAGQNATVTLTTRPWAAEPALNVAEVPSTDDPRPDDNRSELVTAVEPGGPLGGIHGPRRFLLSADTLGQLFVVDPRDGSTRSRLRLRREDGSEIRQARGLAVHPRTGVVWALLGFDGNELATLDPLTGLVRTVGDAGADHTSLAFDDAGTLYSIRLDGVAELVVLSQSDATPTPLLELETGGALAFHPPSGRLYHAFGELRLQAIDLVSFAVEEIEACAVPSLSFFGLAALSHAGGDTFVASEDHTLYSLTTGGVFRRIGSMEQRSGGLAMIEIPRADLEVSAAAAGPARVDESLTVRVTVTHRGPDDLAEAALFHTLPAIASLEAVRPSQGACRRVPCTSELVCALGALAPGASATVELEMTPRLAGTLRHEVTAPLVNDPEPSDNAAEIELEIAPATDARQLFMLPLEEGRLYAVDAVTGAELGAVEIRLGSEVVLGGRGLARHPTSGELWALLTLPGQSGLRLAVIDPATGLARRVGAVDGSFTGLAFDGSGRLWSVRAAELYRLDTGNAAATRVLAFEGESAGDLAWDPVSGLLHHFTGRFSVESVDPATGTVVGERRSCSASQVFAAGHLGGDLVLVGERDHLYAYSATSGGLARLGRLDHEPGGFAIVETRAAGQLTISQRDTPDPARAGDALTYTVEVINEGAGAVFDATVIDHPPGTASLLRATASRGNCRVEACAPAICEAGDLAAGERATFRIEVAPLLPGTVSNTVLAPSSTAPGHAGDTAVRESTEVRPAGRRPSLVSLAAGELRLIDADGTTLSALAIDLPGPPLTGGKGLAAEPATGRLFALVTHQAADASTLIAIDPVGGTVESLSRVSRYFGGLAFDDQGTLWTVFENRDSPVVLYTLDPATGMATPAVEIADLGDRAQIHGRIAWHPEDELLYVAFDSLRLTTVDPRTLNVRDVATCGHGHATSFTHLGRDVLVFAAGQQLRGLTTSGGLVEIGELDHTSGGLTVVDDLVRADLEVRQRVGGRIVVGETATWTVTVRNRGPEAIVGARLVNELPATFSLLSPSGDQGGETLAATASQGRCVEEACGGLVCELGELADGGAVTVELEVRALASGAAGSHAVTTSAAVTFLGDLDPADNRAEAEVTVLPGGPPRALLSLDAVRPRLHEIDPVTGATLGSVDIVLPGAEPAYGRGLALHPQTGEVWALLAVDHHSQSVLVTLDPLSGLARYVGVPGRLFGLAFDADGNAYGMEVASSNIYSDERLMILDLEDGSAAPVLDLGEGEEGEALAFNPTDGRLYRASGGLNRGTGGFAWSRLDLDVPAEMEIAACGGEVMRAGALTHLGDDVLLLADAEGERGLFAVSANGRLTRAGGLDHGSQGLAFVPRLPAAVDLAVTTSAAPDPVMVGEPLTYTMSVSNLGDERFDAVTLLASLPGAVVVDGITASRGSCAPQVCGGFACDLGRLGAGGTADVTLTVTPLVAGLLEHEAEVPALGDGAPDNNTAALAVLAEDSVPLGNGAVMGPLLSVDHEEPTLRVLDPATGATVTSRALILEGATVVSGRGLARHPASGEIWALLSTDYSTQILATLDPRTGVAVAHGETEAFLSNLAFDADGTAWAVTSSSSEPPSALVTVDLSDASVEEVVPAFVEGQTGALAFRPDDGLLVHVDSGLRLRTVDPRSREVVETVRCHFAETTAHAMTHLAGGTMLLATSEDHDNNILRAITADGSVVRLGGTGRLSGGLVLADLPRADLVVGQAVAPDPVVAGEALTYTVTVTNQGPDDMDELRLRDAPPVMARLVSAATPRGSCAPPVCGEIACDLGPLASGDTATLELEVTPFFAGPLANEAEAVALNDPRLENNTSTLVVDVSPEAGERPSVLLVQERSNRVEAFDPVTGEPRGTVTAVLLGDAPAIRGLFGLALHPDTGEAWTLLSIDGSASELGAIDLATGIARRIGVPSEYLDSVAFAADGTLYAVGGNRLFVVDPADASADPVLDLGDGNFRSIAFNPHDGWLYTFGSDQNVLRAVDPRTFDVTDVAISCPQFFRGAVRALAHLDGDALLAIADDTSHDPALFRLTSSGDLALGRSVNHHDVTGMALVSGFGE